MGLSSNGYRNQELLKSLKKIGSPIYIQVSLDGDKETHNKIREAAAPFDDALALISLSSGTRTPCDDNFYCLFKKYRQFKSVLRLCSYNLWPIYINFIRSSGQAKVFDKNNFIPEQKNDLTIAEMEYCYRLWQESARGYMSRLDGLSMVSKTEQVINFIKHGVWSYKCAAGINDAVMYPNGDVAICETRGIIGNLQEYDLDWKNSGTKDRRSSKRVSASGIAL